MTEVKLIPYQPQDGVFDVLVCVLDPDLPEYKLQVWADWVNEDLTDGANERGWSFRVVSVVDPQEGLILSALGLQHIRGAQMAGLSVGIFSPTDLGSAISIYLAYEVLYGSSDTSRGLDQWVDETFEEYFAKEKTRSEFDQTVSPECRTDLEALADQAEMFRKKLAEKCIRSCSGFQKMELERQYRLDGFVKSARVLNDPQSESEDESVVSPLEAAVDPEVVVPDDQVSPNSPRRRRYRKSRKRVSELGQSFSDDYWKNAVPPIANKHYLEKAFEGNKQNSHPKTHRTENANEEYRKKRSKKGRRKSSKKVSPAVSPRSARPMSSRWNCGVVV